jgi:hypothetical protein
VAASATGLEFHPPKSQRLFMAHCYAKYHDEMISTREALLEKLVVSLHLNVPERSNWLIKPAMLSKFFESQSRIKKTV